MCPNIYPGQKQLKRVPCEIFCHSFRNKLLHEFCVTFPFVNLRRRNTVLCDNRVQAETETARTEGRDGVHKGSFPTVSVPLLRSKPARGVSVGNGSMLSDTHNNVTSLSVVKTSALFYPERLPRRITLYRCLAVGGYSVLTRY